MKAHIVYEAAFEHYLRGRQIPYVAVDEARRAAFHDAPLKSFDFIVYAEHGTNWLVDVKGRRWGRRNGHATTGWENWVTRADLDGLSQWETVFGAGFAALLVFAYRLDATEAPLPELVHDFRAARYVFAGIPAGEYRLHARVRSQKWDTVYMPRIHFAERVRPIADWL